jgi:hypothetical protein
MTVITHGPFAAQKIGRRPEAETETLRVTMRPCSRASAA